MSKGDVPKVLSVASLESLRERLAKLDAMRAESAELNRRLKAGETVTMVCTYNEPDYAITRDAIAALEASERDAARLREALARLDHFTFISRWPVKGLDDEAEQMRRLVDAALRRGDPNGL